MHCRKIYVLSFVKLRHCRIDRLSNWQTLSRDSPINRSNSGKAFAQNIETRQERGRAISRTQLERSLHLHLMHGAKNRFVSSLENLLTSLLAIYFSFLSN